MPFFRALLLVLALALLAGGVWWSQSTTPPTPTNTALGGVTLRAVQPDKSAPLRPSVVTAATKLGQGRRAVAGMPKVDDYQLPALRETAAGLALQIPNTPLPSKAAHQFSKPASDVADVTTSNGELVVHFDVYSWSEGVLVATAREPVGLSPQHNLLDVPDALEAFASQFGANRRLLLVLPAGSKDLPEGLNPHDAYIVVAEREA